MRRLLLCAALLLSVHPAASASHGDDERCRDTSRACVIEAAMSYIDALITNDASHIRLAPDAWRINNGHVSVQGEDEVREGVEQGESIVAAIENLRWTVEGDTAVAFYDLYADFTGANGGEPMLPIAAWLPAQIAERFMVVDGLIEEIEVIYWGNPPLVKHDPRPVRNADHGDGPCADGSRACVVSTAQAYLDALVSGDASGVALAPDAWRMENGRNTGDSGEQIRAGIESPTERSVNRIEDVRWFVEGEQAVAYYLLWARPPIVGAPSETDTPVYIAERFRTQDGLLKEIEAVFWVDPPGSQPDPRP